MEISKSDLVSFMKAADSFQIRGLQEKQSLNDSDVKKRRAHEMGPGTSSSNCDPLQAVQHKNASTLDHSEFENESSFDGNEGSESIDDTKFRRAQITQQTSAAEVRKRIEMGDEVSLFFLFIIFR